MKFYSLINYDINRVKKQTVSIIGGGGKSTLLKRLAKELTEEEVKVILTTTTKFQPFPKIGMVLQDDLGDYLFETENILNKKYVVLVAKEYYKEQNKLVGVDKQTVIELMKISDTVLIEADGSRQRCLKTHREYEPVIPTISHHVIIICGADVVGAPLDKKNVHRAELFSQKWELPLGTRLTPEIIARELLSPFSYLKNIPLYANVSILINKVDKNAVGGKLLAEKLVTKCSYPVFLGSLKNNTLERVTLTNY